MNIDSPLRELGPVESDALRDVILSLDDETWRENLTRQEEFEVHRALCTSNSSCLVRFSLHVSSSRDKITSLSASLSTGPNSLKGESIFIIQTSVLSLVS